MLPLDIVKTMNCIDIKNFSTSRINTLNELNKFNLKNDNFIKSIFDQQILHLYIYNNVCLAYANIVDIIGLRYVVNIDESQASPESILYLWHAIKINTKDHWNKIHFDLIQLQISTSCYLNVFKHIKNIPLYVTNYILEKKIEKHVDSASDNKLNDNKNTKNEFKLRKSDIHNIIDDIASAELTTRFNFPGSTVSSRDSFENIFEMYTSYAYYENVSFLEYIDENNNIVGYILSIYNQKHSAQQIGFIYIIPKYRGQNTAIALLNDYEEYFHTKATKYMTVVSSQNFASLNTFISCSYKISKTIINIRSDCI